MTVLQNNIDSTRNISLSTVLLETASVQKQIKRMQDTISTTERTEKIKQVEIINRPLLPKPQPSKSSDYMTLLAEAFSKSYDALSEGTIVEDKDYDRTQTISLAISSDILKDTQTTVVQENKMAQLVQTQEEEVKSDAKINQDLTYGTYALMAVLLVATIASAAFDGGLSLGAVPEELALDGGLGAEEGGEAVEMTAMSSSEELGDAGATGISETEEVMSTTEDMTLDNETENTNELGREEAKTDKPTTGARVKKMLLNMALSAAFGTPQLVQGIESKNQIAPILKQLASEQAAVGSAFAVMQMNNSFNEFFQKILQRKSSVISGQTSEATEIVQKYGDIMNAYRQITYGLARAV